MELAVFGLYGYIWTNENARMLTNENARMLINDMGLI